MVALYRDPEGREIFGKYKSSNSTGIGAKKPNAKTTDEIEMSADAA